MDFTTSIDIWTIFFSKTVKITYEIIYNTCREIIVQSDLLCKFLCWFYYFIISSYKSKEYIYIIF